MVGRFDLGKERGSFLTGGGEAMDPVSSGAGVEETPTSVRVEGGGASSGKEGADGGGRLLSF